jgi:hypothetical protein
MQLRDSYSNNQTNPYLIDLGASDEFVQSEKRSGFQSLSSPITTKRQVEVTHRLIEPLSLKSDSLGFPMSISPKVLRGVMDHKGSGDTTPASRLRSIIQEPSYTMDPHGLQLAPSLQYVDLMNQLGYENIQSLSD